MGEEQILDNLITTSQTVNVGLTAASVGSSSGGAPSALIATAKFIKIVESRAKSKIEFLKKLSPENQILTKLTNLETKFKLSKKPVLPNIDKYKSKIPNMPEVSNIPSLPKAQNFTNDTNIDTNIPTPTFTTPSIPKLPTQSVLDNNFTVVKDLKSSPPLDLTNNNLSNEIEDE